MNKLNKELLARALVEGVDDTYGGASVSLAKESHRYDGFHTTDAYSEAIAWQYVCTKEEYLAAKAKKDKPVIEVDWSKAPEGATHHVKDTDNGSQTQFVRYSKKGLFGEAYYCIDNEGGHWSLHVEDDDVYILTEKPAQPVFTQDMADAGKLPQVGMVFLNTEHFQNKNSINCKKGKSGVREVVIFVSDEFIISKGLVDGNGESAIEIAANYHKPIDTRTEKEKAIDEFTNEMAGKGYENSKLISLAYDKWVGK